MSSRRWDGGPRVSRRLAGRPGAAGRPGRAGRAGGRGHEGPARRRLIVAALAVGLAVLAVAFWLRTTRTTRPNVLLITLDTTRADHLGAYGYRNGATPRLDRLARD